MLLMGEISYSIYILHFVILGPFRADSGTITSWQIALGSYARLIVTFATIVGLSLVSWALLEMPCRKALRNWLTIKREKAAVPPTPQLDESILISASR
jgi:peptidoglycan/LPS O-acetylase OafA/YrhL